MCVTNECHLRDGNIRTDNGLGLAVARRETNLRNEPASKRSSIKFVRLFLTTHLHLFGAQLQMVSSTRQAIVCDSGQSSLYSICVEKEKLKERA